MTRFSARWTKALALLLVAAVSVGCKQKLLGISASISVDPDHLGFGATTIGTPQQIKVSVTNVGSAPLIINKIWVDQNPNNDLTVDDLLTNDCTNNARTGGTTLSPGECATFTVTWAPQVTETAAGDVEIDSSDTLNPAVHLPVTGNAASPLLQYCVLDAFEDGGADCSDLAANPQVKPTVNFGTGLPGTAETRTVSIINNGQAALTFLPEPAIDQTTANASVFSLSGSVPNGTLAPAASQDFVVTATPTANGTVNGFIDVSSNDLLAPSLQIPLQVFVAGWAICVSPQAGLNFGTVTIGQTQELNITFTNCGSTDFTVDSFTFAPFSPTTNQFTITSGALPAANTTFAQGASFTLGVTYAPVAVRTDSASFDYILAVGGSALNGSVPVTGKGAPGACGTDAGDSNPVANIAASYATNQTGPYTNFNPSATPSPVIPLDWIKLNGSASTVTGTPTYLWQLVSQPAGSTTAIVGANSVQAEFQALVSGNYVVTLTVKDASGCIGTETVTISVVPTGAVHLELTWNTSCGDLDLHYANYPGTATGSCTTSSPQDPYDDCAYYNLTTTWGAKLDHDDLDGYGPENITQASAASGNYEVWVYYYAQDSSGSGMSCGTVIPTVNVYFSGTLANTYVLSQGFVPFQAWHVANISVNGSQLNATAGATSPINGPSEPCVGQ